MLSEVRLIFMEKSALEIGNLFHNVISFIKSRNQAMGDRISGFLYKTALIMAKQIWEYKSSC